MKKIYLKGGFSERKGIEHFSDIIQKDEINQRTRNKLYTVTKRRYSQIEYDKAKYYFMVTIYVELFSMAEEDMPSQGYKKWEDIREIFDKSPMNYMFDFVEGVIKTFDLIDKKGYGYDKLKNKYVDDINNIFKEENANYYIINDRITDITSEEEIKSIDKTLDNKNEVVTKHFQKAMEQLYTNKDYANSVKETIQAVEAMCQIICNDSKATLGQALKKIKQEQTVPIHPALESAYEKIYGYVSDAKGTRHANGIGEEETTEAEAKYMLVSCSAFINYLQEIMN